MISDFSFSGSKANPAGSLTGNRAHARTQTPAGRQSVPGRGRGALGWPRQARARWGAAAAAPLWAAASGPLAAWPGPASSKESFPQTSLRNLGNELFLSLMNFKSIVCFAFLANSFRFLVLSQFFCSVLWFFAKWSFTTKLKQNSKNKKNPARLTKHFPEEKIGQPNNNFSAARAVPQGILIFSP